MIAVPRDMTGRALPEGQRVDGMKKAWEVAGELIEGNDEVAYVTIHGPAGALIEELWRPDSLAEKRGWSKK